MTEGPKKKKPSKTGPSKGMTIGDYEIGKGKTDKKTRWKKGCASPNPRGRPRKPKPGSRDIDFFLNEKVTIAGPNGPETFTKRELGYLQIANHFAKGAPWALKLAPPNPDGGDGAIDPMLFDEQLARDIVANALRDLSADEGKSGKDGGGSPK